jgi:hypothetical protein
MITRSRLAVSLSVVCLGFLVPVAKTQAQSGQYRGARDDQADVAGQFRGATRQSQAVGNRPGPAELPRHLRPPCLKPVSSLSSAHERKTRGGGRRFRLFR